MSQVEQNTPQQEHQYHYYTGSRIPWYVRLLWLFFWGFAVFYMVKYFLPTIQLEMVSPP
ncbi:MAG: hypothetical protein AB7O26_13820 [Planctomycetaceae bacterium]